MARKVGYDYDFVTAPPKSLECPVCLMTFRDPHVISCCGNEFCQLCIERVQRDGKPCPLCNELNFTTFLHKRLVREVNGLVVRCPQKELGCEWEGELGQVEQHLNPGAGLSSSSGCGYVMVECSFQCGAHLQRRMVGEHEMKSCPKRPIYIEMQVASLMRKFEVITAENKMLKKELSVMKEKMSEVTENHKQELDEVKQTNQKQQEELKKALKEVQLSYDELKKKQDAVRVDFDKRCVELRTHTSPLPVPPFYFALVNIDHYMKNDLGCDSEPFYSHPGGYRIFMTVFPNGFDSCKGTHVLLGLHIQRGEFDDQLQWPFKGKVTVQVYNNTTEKWSNERTIFLSKERCGMRAVQRCLDVQTYGGLSIADFLPLPEFKKHYLKYNSARFRVIKVEIM